MYLITVVIPFSVRKHDKECLQRLKNAVSCFDSATSIEVLVYDTTPNLAYEPSAIVRGQQHVRYISNPQSTLFSPGFVRNQAVGETRSPYILFFDADHICSKDFASSLIEKAKALESIGPSAFAMFPFLYLSKAKDKSIFW